MTSRTAKLINAPNGGSPVDLVHLSRQTFGNRSLEREILALFATQSAACIDKLRAADTAKDRANVVHTLKGSAQSIGAWAIAEAALAVESAARQGGPLDAELEAGLMTEVAATNAYIASLLADA